MQLRGIHSSYLKAGIVRVRPAGKAILADAALHDHSPEPIQRAGRRPAVKNGTSACRGADCSRRNGFLLFSTTAKITACPANIRERVFFGRVVSRMRRPETRLPDAAMSFSGEPIWPLSASPTGCVASHCLRVA
jgi:hypothetical protein